MGVEAPLTPREHYLAAVAKRKEAWEHTSALLAMMHNILSQKPKSPDDFNPFALQERSTLPEGPDPSNWKQMLGAIKKTLGG